MPVAKRAIALVMVAVSRPMQAARLMRSTVVAADGGELADDDDEVSGECVAGCWSAASWMRCRRSKIGRSLSLVWLKDSVKWSSAASAVLVRECVCG